MYRRDVLEFAYVRCRINGGAAGVDRQTFEDIEAYGLDRWLDEVADELRIERIDRTRCGGFTSQRRTASNDRWASLRSRIASCRWRWFWSWSRSSRPTWNPSNTPTGRPQRPGRREAGPRAVNTGHTEVVDADLSGYFDSIPHAELMKSVSRRVSDRHLLALIAKWLESPVEEIDERGRHHRTTRNKDEGRGTPQGSPLSPLLSNLYMRRFVLGWKPGARARLDAHIVNYADDFVICCRGTASEAMTAMRAMMSRLRLTVNETKTRRCRVPEETFDFWVTRSAGVSSQTGSPYIGTRPSAKKIALLRDEIRELTDRRWLWTESRTEWHD